MLDIKETVNRHTRVLDGNTQILDGYTQVLDGHTELLNEILRRLDAR